VQRTLKVCNHSSKQNTTAHHITTGTITAVSYYFVSLITSHCTTFDFYNSLILTLH